MVITRVCAATALIFLSGWHMTCYPYTAKRHKKMTVTASQSNKSKTSQEMSEPGTRWSVGKLREVTAVTRVGKTLMPEAWPNGARVAVCLTFDVDTESYLLAAGETSPSTLSAADYAAEEGLSRVLDVINKYQVPATFFVPAVSAILHPEIIPAIMKGEKNEIGVHGWIHESPPLLAPGEEVRLLDDAIAYLTKVTGKRPAGYRAPGWAFSQETMGLLEKNGFVYDSSLHAMDRPYEITSNGKDTGIIELPIDWTLTESVYLGPQGHMPSPALLFQLYQDEFDGAYQEGTLFILTLHPQFAGHRAPMHYLDQLIAHMKSRPGVWFATGSEVAQYLRSTQSKQ